MRLECDGAPSGQGKQQGEGGEGAWAGDEEGLLRCSIVGNSGVMLDSGMGSEVDSSGAVFRVNQAPTRQHEGDVGRTTAVRVLNNAFLHFTAV